MAAGAHEVPHKFDCVISDGTTSQGYILHDASDKGTPNIPERAIHSFSPMFVPRTNVEGGYGDNKQDFFMTFSQKDWSLGEGVKYQADSGQSFWRGTNVDVTKPGQVTIRNNVDELALAANMSSSTKGYVDQLFFATSTNLYGIPADGAIDDHGAHGLGAAPDLTGMTSDGEDVYLTSTAGGSVGVRKFNGVATYTTFSATGANSLAYLNNALYGYVQSTSALVRYTTAGVASTLFTFQGADGGAKGDAARLLPFGGKLLILHFGDYPNSLWIYDGVGVSKLAQLPHNFESWDIAIVNGIVFISGYFIQGNSAATTQRKNAVYYYANGDVGLLWSADTFLPLSTAYIPGIAEFEGGLVIADSSTGTLLFYNPVTGGFHTLGTLSAHTSSTQMATSHYYLFVGSVQATANLYPERSVIATTATVTSSLIDFDSSLDKLFRGIKVEFVDGGGTSTVDIAYRIGDVDGAYTSLQADATSGTEYTLGSVGSAIEGRSISVRVTLNKGDSAAGPVLKRVYVRAAPIVNVFHRGRHSLDCQGVGDRYGETIRLRDESHSPQTGLELATTLKGFAEAGLVTFTDKFGSRTSVLEELEFTEIRPNEFIASVLVREV